MYLKAFMIETPQHSKKSRVAINLRVGERKYFQDSGVGPPPMVDHNVHVHTINNKAKWRKLVKYLYSSDEMDN